MANILQELLVKIGADVSGFIEGTNDVAKGLDDISSAVEKNFASLDKMGARFTEIGKGLTAAITLPLAGIGAAAIKAAVDFDDASDRIRAKTGATGEALAGLTGVFKDVFSTIPASAKDASEAISGLATRLGLAGEPLKELATQELNLARITETSIVPLVASTTRLFGDWSIATKDQAGALDYLYKVTQGTGIGIQKLTDLIVQFGAPMRALGLDMEHAAALLGKFEKEGVNITTVLSGLRQELSRMAKAGIDTSAGFTAVIDRIKNMTSETDALSISAKIFGQRAAVDMFRAIKEGRFDVDALTDSLKKNSETINKAAADTLSFTDKLTLFKNKLETALEPIGTKLTGVFEKWLDASGPFLKSLEDMAEGFSKLSPSTQAWITGLTLAAAAIGPILIGVGAVVSGFTALAPAFAVVTAAITGVGVEMTAAQGLFMGFSAVLVGVGAALLAFNQIKGLGEDLRQLADDVGITTNVFTTLGNLFAEFPQEAESLGRSLDTNGKAIDEVGKFADGTARKFTDMQLAWSDAVTAFSNIDWWKLLAGPLGMLRDAVQKTSDLYHTFKGQFPEIDAAAKNLANGLQSTVTAHERVSKAALDQVAAQRGLVGSSNAASKATTGLGVDLSALTDKHKLSTEQIQKHQLALQKSVDAYVMASAAATKYKNNLDGLDNIKLAKLSLGGPDFKAYEAELKAFGAEMDAARTRVTTFYNEVAGGRNATEAIRQLGAAFANTEQALRDFGIMSKVSYQSLVQQNSDYLKQILRDTDLTNTQKEQARIVFAQREIDLARKTGQEITDAEIESLEKQKAAYAKAHLDIEQSYKILGMNSTAEIQRQADLVAAAYAKVANSALSTQADIDKAHLAMMKADAEATIAHGKAITETQKRAMDDLETIVRNGHKTLEGQWDLFSNHVGDAIANLSVKLGEKLFTGKGSFGDIAKTAWKDIQKSLVSDFIAPAEESIAKFISKSIAALLSEEGIAGVKKAWKDLGDSIKATMGIASSATKTASKSVGLPTGGGVRAPGDTSEADYDPSAGGGGTDSAGGGASSFTPMGIVSAGINAAGFTAMGILLSRIVSTIGKVEVNTREMSVVMWQNGNESLQGIAKMSWQTLLQINDRLIDIRSAIFDPLTLTLSGMWETLKRVGVGSGSGGEGGGGSNSGVPLVIRMPTILPLQDFENPGQMTPDTPKYTSGFLSAVFDQSSRDQFSADPGTGRFGSVIESVGETLTSFGEVATNALTGFSDAVQNTAQSIASSVASLVPPMNFSDSPLPALGSQIVPTITQQPYQNVGFRDFGPMQRNDRPIQANLYIDGQQVTSAIVNSLEQQGVRI